MDEEDTFWKLKRIGFDKLGRIINDLTPDEFNRIFYDKAAKEEFLRFHGWRPIDLINHINKIQIKETR